MRRPFRKRPPLGNSTVVVLIDMQDGFFSSLDEESLKALVQAQIKVIRQCAELDIPLAVLEFKGYGSTVAQLAAEIEKVPRVFRGTKRRDNGLSQPKLRDWLAEMDAGTLVLLGVNASYCVLSTAKAALKAGYRVVTGPSLIADCSCCESKKRIKRWYRRRTDFRHEDIGLADL